MRNFCPVGVCLSPLPPYSFAQDVRVWRGGFDKSHTILIATVQNYARERSSIRAEGTCIQADTYAGTSVSLCVCSWVCLSVENWMTAHLSLQSHSVALEWHCRWMSLKCSSEDASTPTETDAKCSYLPNFGDQGSTF